MGDDKPVPAALRPFTVQLAPHAFRVRLERGRHFVYVRGVLLGMLTEGEASVYFQTPTKQGKLYASVEEFDATFKLSLK